MVALTISIFDPGHIDNAIVGGTQITLEALPQAHDGSVGHLFPVTGMSSVLDETADGFVKSDAVACVFLQRRVNAKRVYATVRSARMNVDGHKKGGQFFPSSDAHEILMVQSYKENNINPLRLTYFEGHLTGTRVCWLSSCEQYF